MTSLKVSQATPRQLSWLVAKCLGYEPQWFEVKEDYVLNGNAAVVFLKEFDPVTNWAQGGPIFSAAGIQCHVNEAHTEWLASCWGYPRQQYGETELLAKARCFVAFNLCKDWGEEVEVPDDLA